MIINKVFISGRFCKFGVKELYVVCYYIYKELIVVIYVKLSFILQMKKVVLRG